MDIEALARLIAEKVLDELGSLPQSRQPETRVLVFAAQSAELTASLQTKFGDDAELVYYRQSLPVDGYARYIIPYLCCPNMAALAAGQSTCAMTGAVLRLLLAGQTIEVMEFEYQRYKDTAPDKLYSLYEDYADTLHSFGLVAFNPCAGSLVRLRENLVTEKMIKAMASQGFGGVIVPQGAIVTDLAVETALGMNFHVQRVHKEG